MHKQSHLHNETPLSNGTDETTYMCSNMDEYQNHYARLKKLAEISIYWMTLFISSLLQSNLDFSDK